MLTFPNPTLAIDEDSIARMNFRTKPRIKAAIQTAAALSGVEDTMFVMTTAYQAALDTIAAHERTTLAPADNAAFFTAMDAPVAPTDRLQRAHARHKATVTSA
jgi:uncharacterized protein (DUF1778 family)